MRILTLNLHNPIHHEFKAIAAFLDESGAELLVLTECNRQATESLGKLLDCVGVAHAPAPYWGNGLLTRKQPILTTKALMLPESRHGEKRSAVVAQVRTTCGTCRFVGTHLDHLTEENRLLQARYLAGNTDLSKSLLLGDLNALTAADYTPSQWADIAAQRAEAQLSPPATELTDWLRNELGLRDAHDARPADATFSPTCPYGTRIDYVLFGPRCGLRPVPGSYEVLDAMGKELTDHNAVVVEVEAQAERHLPTKPQDS